MSKNALIIFIKNPIKGRVKTRLAKDLGDNEALQVYQKLLTRTREVVEQVESTRFLFYKDEIIQDAWHPKLFEKRQQCNGNLGEKMSQAFQEVFDLGFKKVVIIGSDCPEISKSIIEDAFKKLSSCSVVLGPANDGGYYLLGMKTWHESLFDLTEWSTNRVLEETLRIAKKKSLSHYLLKELIDIDTIDDLRNYKSK